MASVRNCFRAIRLLLTLRCEESERLMSDAFERDLTGVERWAVRLHFIGCKPCRKVRQQLADLQRLARDRAAEAATLAAEARRRIRQQILGSDDG